MTPHMESEPGKEDMLLEVSRHRIGAPIYADQPWLS